MTTETNAPRSKSRLMVLLPLAVFMVLAAIFMLQLMSGRDAAEIPSALIGQPAPETKLAPLEGTGLPGVDSTLFKGKVTVLNVWASWCVPCRVEHPVLSSLSQDGRFDLEGLNYKDKAENAAAFLGELGNPYSAVGVDPAGRAGIDWGVYGVPETFIIGKDGKIAFKHVGPLTEDSVRSEMLPAIAKALAAK